MRAFLQQFLVPSAASLAVVSYSADASLAVVSYSAAASLAVVSCSAAASLAVSAAASLAEVSYLVLLFSRRWCSASFYDSVTHFSEDDRT